MSSWLDALRTPSPRESEWADVPFWEPPATAPDPAEIIDSTAEDLPSVGSGWEEPAAGPLDSTEPVVAFVEPGTAAESGVESRGAAGGTGPVSEPASSVEPSGMSAGARRSRSADATVVFDRVGRLPAQRPAGKPGQHRLAKGTAAESAPSPEPVKGASPKGAAQESAKSAGGKDSAKGASGKGASGREKDGKGRASLPSVSLLSPSGFFTTLPPGVIPPVPAKPKPTAKKAAPQPASQPAPQPAKDAPQAITAPEKHAELPSAERPALTAGDALRRTTGAHRAVTGDARRSRSLADTGPRRAIEAAPGVPDRPAIEAAGAPAAIESTGAAVESAGARRAVEAARERTGSHRAIGSSTSSWQAPEKKNRAKGPGRHSVEALSFTAEFEAIARETTREFEETAERMGVEPTRHLRAAGPLTPGLAPLRAVRGSAKIGRLVALGLVALLGVGAFAARPKHEDPDVAARLAADRSAATAADRSLDRTPASASANPMSTAAATTKPSASASASPKAGPTKAPLVAGLDRMQMDNAQTIVQVGQKLGIPKRGLIVAIATAIQESNLYNQASSAVPESLNYPHQYSSVDYDSVGLFQQRTSMGWGTVKQIMDPVYSATKFYNALKQVSGWQGMAITVAAQTVQGSAFPDAYAQHEGVATTVVNALT
ncbi:hypothetical protein [Hamadaea tsunoensis]|uniref:hypothetical protein n=1 Tax=Hamadaea tsunoensis TaxID=53368 RepID=UPI0004200844|nr:hypothetical protein [Hamadaea tsunoensis]